MTDVKSKNLYELLGNTSDQDSDREPDVLPKKTVDKPAGRSGKRDEPKAAPTEPVGDLGRGPRQPRRGEYRGGSEGAFRDRNAGREHNRGQPTEAEDGVRPGRDSGPGTRRGGRGSRGDRGPRRGGDRHSRTGLTDNPKQGDAAWGQPTGDGEWADEKAGEAIAKKEEASGWTAGGAEAFDSTGEAAKVPKSTWDAGEENPDFKDSSAPADAPAGNGLEEEAEPEDNSKSYADWLVEQAAKKMEDLGLKEARAPNEGLKENKQWKNAKPLTKEEDADYFEATAKGKRERERERKTKEKVDIDFTFKEPEQRGGRGGGRGARGDRGDRGEFRGRGRGRGGEGSFRGDREGGFRGDREGGYRGGRGRGGDRGGDRGDFRGRGRGRGRGDIGGNAPAVSLSEDSFPSLGGSK